MEKSEPLPLFLVTHHGVLAVNDNQSLANHRAVDDQSGHLFETLVDVTAQMPARYRESHNSRH